MTNSDTPNWHKESGSSAKKTTFSHSNPRYRQLANWADEQKVREVFDAVYLGLGFSETMIGLGNVVQELSYPESSNTLSAWSLHPVVSQCRKLATAYQESPEIASEYRPIPPAGSVGQNKARLKIAGADTQNRHFILLLLVTPLVGDQINSRQYHHRRVFRLWLFIQAMEHVIYHGCHSDGLIRDIVNFMLKPPFHSNWVVVDAVLRRTSQLLIGEQSFTRYNLVLKQAARQLRLEYEQKGFRRFLNAIESIASGHCSPIESTHPEPAIPHHFANFGVREFIHPKLALDGIHYQDLELPPDSDEEPEDASDSALLFEVDPTETPERQQLTGQSILVQSTELSHYLPWSWDKPLPPELRDLDHWITSQLSAIEPMARFGAACVWLASRLSRSLPFVLEVTIDQTPGEEWTLSPDFKYAHRLVPRRHNSWYPDEEAMEWVHPFKDQLAVAIPEDVQRVLVETHANAPIRATSLWALWYSITDEPPEAWFNQQARLHFPRLTSAKLANACSQGAFNRSGDHSLARLLSAHPRSALPAACGYANWDIAQVERGFDLSLKDSATEKMGGRMIALGSVLDPLEQVLLDGIRTATQKLNDAARGCLVAYHNAVAQYCVMALYAATGCRHLKDPFESVSHFSDTPACVYVNDKNDGGLHSGRLVPLPQQALSILQAYLSHLKRLAEKIETVSAKFAGEIRKLSEGPSTAMPLFFQLDAGLGWQSMTAQGLPGEALFDWKLPHNLFRHRYAQQLGRAGVHPEVVDGWMGHAERGAATYGDASPRCWADDVTRYRGVIDDLFAQLAFEIPATDQPLPDPPEFTGMDQALLGEKKQAFGQKARKRKRQQVVRTAIRSAKDDIRLFMGERTFDEIDESEISTLERLMLSREDGLPHPQAAIRYGVLTKYIQRSDNSKKAAIKRRMTKIESERSWLTDQCPASLKLWPDLQLWCAKTQPVIQKAHLSKSQALIFAAVFLAVTKRLTYRRLLNDVLSGTNYRLLQNKGAIFLEYNEQLDPDDWSAPVQRHAIDYKSASLLAHGAGIQSPVIADDTPCPDGLAELVTLLWPDQNLSGSSEDGRSLTVGKVLDRLLMHIAQANLIQLPGIVSAALSKRCPPTSMNIRDYLRLTEGVIYDIPNDSSVDQDLDLSPSPISRLVRQLTDRKTLQQNAKVFFEGLHGLLDGSYGSSETPKPDKKEAIQTGGSGGKGRVDSSKNKAIMLARSIEKYCKAESGSVSSAILYVGYWLAARIRQGKGRPGRHYKAYAASTPHRYLSALSGPFQGLAYDVDLNLLDEEEVTDLYHQMLTIQRNNGRDLNYFGNRLSEFIRWAEKHGVNGPIWEELDLGEAHRTVKPGVMSESEYLRCFRKILEGRTESSEHPMFTAFVLMAAYRFGLRAQEAIGLLRRDWCESASLDWVLLRANRYRTLKSASSRRAVPLLSDLTHEERNLVRQLLARYHSMVGERTNLPILCELNAGTAELTEIYASIPSAIARVIKSVTGNPILSLHHARHAYYNALAPIVFGVDTPLTRSLTGSLEKNAVLQMMLGDEHSVSRRSPMALARAMGHMHPGTGFKNYNHMTTDWADALTPVVETRVRELSGAVQVHKWPTKKLSQESQPEALFQFQPPTMTHLLSVLRLVALGMSFAQAGENMRVSPTVISEIRGLLGEVSKKFRYKVVNPETGKPRLLAGDQFACDELVKRLTDGAWMRLMEHAESLDASTESWADELTALSKEEIAELVGLDGHLLMYRYEQCEFVRAFLLLFDVPETQYHVVLKERNYKKTNKIKNILEEVGFTVTDDPKKSAELRLYSKDDNDIEFKSAQHGGIILSTSANACIRNRFDLSVALIVTSIINHYIK